MEIKFDTKAAEELIRNMNSYCVDIVQQRKKLIEIMNNVNSSWDDYQSKAFDNHMRDIIEELNECLNNESEFMKIYQEKIIQLRG